MLKALLLSLIALLPAGIPSYGEIYVTDGVTAQSIPNGATYTKSTMFTTAHLSANLNADSANDRLVISNPGIYRVNWNCSFTSGTNNVVWYGAFFLDGVEQNDIHWNQKVATGTDVETVNCSGFVQCPAGGAIDVRLRHDNGGAVNFTGVFSNLSADKVGN